MKEQIMTGINAAPEKEDDKEIINEIFLAKYTQKQNRKNSLLQFGIRNIKQLLTNCTPAAREDALTGIANQCLRDVRKGMPLAESKKKTDDALKILIDLYKEKRCTISPEISILIAEAYYLASVAILPKGITIPEKKKEALRKGIEFIDRVIDQLKDSSPATVSNEEAPSQAKSGLSTGAELGEEAFRIKCLLSIEQNRIDKNNCDDETLKEILIKAVASRCNKYNEREEDVRIAVRLCELAEADSINPEDVINSPKADYLQKAKICYFLNKDNDNTQEHLKECIKTLKNKYLSHRLWDETVDFIERLRQDKNSLWKDFALRAYEACRKQERNTSVFRLRWYWSRQRPLYDMAFLAAKEDNNVMKMAEISDSLKSRTSLRLSALQKIKGADERINGLYDGIEKNHKDSYVKSSTDGVENIEEIEEKDPEKVDYTSVPKGWLVVHFYLNQLEKRGYVIIYDKDKDAWDYKDFKYNELFDAFMTWQTNYSLYKEKAAVHLVALCRKIGETIHFLFDGTFIPSGKDVLFIPHDFLHRLPLHGAIKKNTNEVFLVNHACCYLPAWSFAGESSTDHENADQSCTGQSHDEQSNAEPSQSMEELTVHKHVLLKNFEEHDQSYFKDIVAMNWDLKRIAASHEDLKKVNSPELLAILCHGEVDVANPFRSKLKLANGGITHLEILKSVDGVKGAQIILGACETDLVPPLSDIMDEHTSVATAFLIKEARGILGTMWEVRTDKIEELIIYLLDKFKNNGIRKNMQTLLNEWQKESIEDYIYSLTLFYRGIAFRSIGFPL